MNKARKGRILVSQKRKLLISRIWHRSPIGRRQMTQNHFSVSSNLTGATICAYRITVSISDFQSDGVVSITTRRSKGLSRPYSKRDYLESQNNFPLPIYEENGVLSGGDRGNWHLEIVIFSPQLVVANSQIVESILREFEAFSALSPSRQNRLTIYSMVALRTLF